jgi:hypothetical protein
MINLIQGLQVSHASWGRDHYDHSIQSMFTCACFVFVSCILLCMAPVVLDDFVNKVFIYDIYYVNA